MNEDAAPRRGSGLTEVLHSLTRHCYWSGYEPYGIDPIDVLVATHA